jgi:peptide/nickel transport system substrate-binding protein
MFRRAALVIAAVLPLGVQAQTLDIAVDQSPAGLDPHVATAFSSAQINSVIYEGLTAIDRDLKVVPALADHWTISPDGLTYDFILRKDAKFHNGRPVEAADIVANLERVRDPKTASPLASRFTAIRSFQEVDRNEVKLVLGEPSAPLLGQLASLAIIAPEAVTEIGRKPMGTGAFKMKEWVPDTYILLEKNPAYWDPALPKLAAVKFAIVPDAATRQLGIAGGTYKLAPAIDPATAAGLAGKPGVKILETQDLAYALIGFNASKPPFDNPLVREAANLAIDRGQLVQAAYFGRGVAGGPLSPALTAWTLPNSAFSCYKPDAAAAKGKLAAAGIALPLKVTINVLGSVKQVVDNAQVVQAQMNKAGFDVTLNVQELGKFVADWRASNFEAFASLNGGGVDPDDYFGRTFATGGATNVFKYSNPALDALMTQARAETNPSKRKTQYDSAQKMLACTGPVATLAYGTLFTAVRDDVSGFVPVATRSMWYLRETTLGK